MDKQQREYIHHLMLQYSDAMVRLTYRRVGDWHLAEDLVQETFLTACCKSERVCGHKKPVAWLFETLNNLTLRESRRFYHTEVSIEDIAESYELTELPMACHIPMGLSGSEQEIIITASAMGFQPVQAVLRWAEGIIQIYTNPSGIMELPDDDPSEYHSLYEALAANGISTEGLPTWVPRDYAVSAIAVKLSDGVLKCSAIYDSTRGGLVIRVIEHTMALSTEAKELDSLGSVYTHNQTEYYILTDDGVTKAGWQDGMLSYVISGQISEAEIKEMINSIQ